MYLKPRQQKIKLYRCKCTFEHISQVTQASGLGASKGLVAEMTQEEVAECSLPIEALKSTRGQEEDMAW